MHCQVTLQLFVQLNKIIEACEYASDAYWGNPQRYQFMAQIDSFSSVNELPQDEMRVVSSTFNINMYGYIIPDTVQKQLSSVKKYNSKSKIIILDNLITGYKKLKSGNIKGIERYDSNNLDVLNMWFKYVGSADTKTLVKSILVCNTFGSKTGKVNKMYKTSTPYTKLKKVPEYRSKMQKTTIANKDYLFN